MAQHSSIRNVLQYYQLYVTPFEVGMMERFFTLRRIGALKALFIIASRLGDGPLWVMAGTWLMIAGDARHRLAVLTALVAVLASVLTFLGLKNLIGRPRPFESWQSLTCLMAPPDKFSFPSGHTMTAFTVWTALSMTIPGLTLPFLLAAVLIGLSRIFLGLHYPTDVLVGALLGSGIGLMISFGAKELLLF